MSNEVALIQAGDINRIERMAEAVAKSGLFGLKTKDQAMALMLVAESEGRHPASAAKDYHIISNNPSKKAEAMLRDFLLAGGKVEWHSLDDKKADATFSHPQGGTARIDWNLERAAQAGLTKNANWQKYPRAMLRSRVVSEGVRTIYPAATSGMYVPEEVQDFEPSKRVKHEPVKDAIDVESKPLSEQMPPPRKDNPLLDRAKDFAKQVKACKQGGLDDLVMENVSLMNELSKEEPGLHKLALQRIAEKRAAFHTDPELDDAVPEFAETDADKLANQLKGAA